MKCVFRVDASLQIGTGHVMRCLTLAEVLKNKGNDVYFICRRHTGHLIELIQQRSYVVFCLEHSALKSYADGLAHSNWLAVSQAQDAEQCAAFLAQLQVDWLIVDHYALDHRWQSDLKPYCQHIMVIDDLADRKHDCSILLDQNYGRKVQAYQALTPPGCKLLMGLDYALLRPEFSVWRNQSLARRQAPVLKHICITMGGVDVDNMTTQVLNAIQLLKLESCLHISVVLGETAPHLEQVKQCAKKIHQQVKVLSNVQNMAELMASADLAIGALGTMTWERCCLGLPSLGLILADNQRYGAEQLAKDDIIYLLDERNIVVSLQTFFSGNITAQLKLLSNKSAAILDGSGANKVADVMLTV